MKARGWKARGSWRNTPVCFCVPVSPSLDVHPHQPLVLPSPNGHQLCALYDNNTMLVGARGLDSNIVGIAL